MSLNKNLLVRVIILFVITLTILACGSNQNVTNPTIDTDYNDNVAKIVTWNLKEFPLTTNTINELQHLIPVMNSDIIGVQEITDTDEFRKLDFFLNDYSVIYSEEYVYDPQDPESYYNPILGYVYNQQRVEISESYEIFHHDSRLFPREPFIIEASWNEQEFLIINVHLKAGGNNSINESYPWDEEVRRRDALYALNEYIINNHNDKNVILLGDFNDQFHEPEETNVFTAFLEDGNFEFADYEMSLDSSDFSYPNWPSHLDHIIVNHNLFDVFASEKSQCYTLKYDEIDSSYFNTISDHRPVVLELDYSTYK